MPPSEVVGVEFKNHIAWVVVDNPPVNATSTAVRAGLQSAITRIAAGGVDVQAAVLLCAGRSFIAGGDMSEFDAPPAKPDLPDIVLMLEDSPVPVLAAMHGNVFGGGLELAMGCAWRIAVKGTRFALPEVKVGLVPGAGGSQRLPRLVGMELAIAMAAGGRIVDARTMFEAGGIDRIISGDPRKAAEDFVAERLQRPVKLRERTVVPLCAQRLEIERLALVKKARGQHSPLHNFAAIQWSLLPFEEGRSRERALHLKLRDSTESKALRYAFFAERSVAKPAGIKGGTARPLNRMAVIGGGLMGAGIATAAVLAGLSVTLMERNTDAAENAREQVHTHLEGALRRGKIDKTALEEMKARFVTTTDYEAAAGHDLAIEAVFEDIDVKREVFRALAAIMARDAILATNTSYLDPEAIFAGIDNPDRCLGLHFFSPAHIMRLLEVVRMEATGADTLATAFALGKRLRKLPVLAGICDGFIGNRMLAAYRREAEYLLADGALPHEIDDAMREFGFAMGPFQAQDMGGLQIAWAHRKAKTPRRNRDRRYVTIADTLCEVGRLGRRGGTGWYDYPSGPNSMTPSPIVEDIILSYSTRHGIPRRAMTSREIAARLLAVVINEGALILEESIAETAEAIDMVQLHGYGFPRWRGGPMFHADTVGWGTIAATMARVAEESPLSWIIAHRLESRRKI